ncbi:uncharacterized protein LOC144038684 [Vanacampus margaritifer]
MAALWLLVVLEHVLLMDTGLCVPVDVKQVEFNALFKKDVFLNDDSLQQVSELVQAFAFVLKLQHNAKVEQDDRVSNIQQQHSYMSSSQLNVNQQHGNMSNVQQNVLDQQRYNISMNDQQSEILPPSNMSSYHNDKMDDVGGWRAVFVKV